MCMRSPLADQFLDAALELALLDLAAAQPFVEVARRRVRHHGAEGKADAARLAPDHLGEERAALARDAQADLFREPCGLVDLDAGAALIDVAHHAIHGRAALVDFGDAAKEHLVAHALTSVLHGQLREWKGNSRPVPREEQGRRTRFVALT